MCSPYPSLPDEGDTADVRLRIMNRPQPERGGDVDAIDHVVWARGRGGTEALEEVRRF